MGVKRCHLRGGDDDFGIWNVLVKGRVGTLLVRGGDELVALLLDPLPETKLVLGGTKKSGLISGVLVALKELSDLLKSTNGAPGKCTYVVENEENLALAGRSRSQRPDTTGLTEGVEGSSAEGLRSSAGSNTGEYHFV